MKCSKKNGLFGVLMLVLLVVSLFALFPVYADPYEPDFLVTDPYFYHYDSWEPVWSVAGAVGWDASDDYGWTYFWNNSFGGWYESISEIECEGWHGWINNSYRNRWAPAWVPPNLAEHGNSILFQGQFPHTDDVLGTWEDFWIPYPCPEDTLILEFTVENVCEYPYGEVSNREEPEDWQWGTGVADGILATTTPFVSVGPDVFFDVEPNYESGFPDYWTWFNYSGPEAGLPVDVLMADFFPIHFWDTTGSPDGVGFEVQEIYNWTQGNLVCGIMNP